MIRSALAWVFCPVTILCIFACTHKDGLTPHCDSTYVADIWPIVTQKCSFPGCHGAGSAIADFTNYYVMKTLADTGRIYEYVFALKIMPPSTVDTLTDAERNKLKCWIDNGAPE